MSKKIRMNKPVPNNATPNSKLQFGVAKDLDKAKKVKPAQVFEKVKIGGNPKKPKKCKC